MDHPCQFDKWNCQVFINIRKYKIVFKTRKDYLRIIFFRWLYKTAVLSKFISMQEVNVCNNWIILDPLGNIYEIHANLAVMTTLLNFNHF